MDEAFGHWLAGFTDGEGCFVIARVTSKNGNPNGKTWPVARYEVTVRADDIAIIEEIARQLGYGRVIAHSAKSAARPNAKPSARFSVWRIEDCLKVVTLFTRYPLRGKKRRQFNVWALGVHEIAKGRSRDDNFVDDLRSDLARLRVYDGDPLAYHLPQEWTPQPRRIDRGEAPPCLCGCGGRTLATNGQRAVRHPDNPHYSSFMRGHNRRLIKTKREDALTMKS